MPLYMTQFSYTAEAIAALAKNPEDRSVPVKALIEKLGGKMFGFYYCLGEYDGVVISEASDETALLTTIFAVIAPGHLKAIKTTPLFTVEQVMEAAGKAGAIVFAPPKG